MKYLDGLRGLAALQVVLFHYGNIFLPVAVGSGTLRFLTNGLSAVYLFFLMSGVVLTYSFERRPRAVGAGITGRVVRLGLPLGAAALIGAAFMFVLPETFREAATLAHSNWTARFYTGAYRPVYVIMDATGLTTILGYSGTSIFEALRPFLPPQTASMDQPFWTLHIELWGSLLVLALVYAHARSRWLHGAAVVAASALTGAHPLGLFIVGHVTALALADSRLDAIMRRRWVVGAGLGLLLAGVIVCTHNGLPFVRGLGQLLMLGKLIPVQEYFNWNDEFAAVLIFFGILLASPIQEVLQLPAIQQLGRLSFPIYLLHWPVMMTLGSAVFLAALPYAGQVLAAITALAIGGALTLLLSDLFERRIDAPAVSLSRRLRDAAGAPVQGGGRDGAQGHATYSKLRHDRLDSQSP